MVVNFSRHLNFREVVSCEVCRIEGKIGCEIYLLQLRLSLCQARDKLK